MTPPRGGATPGSRRGGARAGEFPCRGRGDSARFESRRRGRGSRPGVPKLLAAPPRPPSCPRPDSRGGGGGDQAGSGCAAAGLPPQVGECGPGRVSALPKGRLESRAQERLGHLEGPGRERAWGPPRSRGAGVASALRGNRAGPRSCGRPEGAWGPLPGAGASLQRRVCAKLRPRRGLGAQPGVWSVGVALRFLIYPE